MTIARNDISYCGHEAIDTPPNATLLVENNTIHDNHYGIWIHSNLSTVRNNQFLRNSASAISIRDDNSIYTESSHPTISGNVFIDNKADIATVDFVGFW